MIAAVTVLVAAIAERIPSDQLLSVAFGAAAIMLATAAVTILRRVIVGASRVDFRTILGALSVFTLIGLLFAFLYFAFGRWTGGEFFSGVAQARASDYLFFSYTTLTTTGYGNLVPAGSVGQSFAVLEMLVDRSSSSPSSPGWSAFGVPAPPRHGRTGPTPDRSPRARPSRGP